MVSSPSAEINSVICIPHLMHTNAYNYCIETFCIDRIPVLTRFQYFVSVIQLFLSLGT